MLEKYQPAPAFSLPNQHNQLVSLSDFRGKQHVVLYFYPKDDTPGCTIEANQFTALAGEFAKAGTAVLGVSKDSCASHQAFIGKYDLTLDLLADTTGSLCERYGVWQEKEKNGEKKNGYRAFDLSYRQERRFAGSHLQRQCRRPRTGHAGQGEAVVTTGPTASKPCTGRPCSTAGIAPGIR